MDTRSPIPMRPTLKQRDRGASTPAFVEPQAIVNDGLIRAHRNGTIVGAIIATAIYIGLEFGRALL